MTRDFRNRLLMTKAKRDVLTNLLLFCNLFVDILLFLYLFLLPMFVNLIVFFHIFNVSAIRIYCSFCINYRLTHRLIIIKMSHVFSTEVWLNY